MKKILAALLIGLFVGVAGMATAEILTEGQLIDIKKLAARFNVTESQVDELIAEAKQTQYHADEAYKNAKRIVIWLSDSGFDTTELNDIVIPQVAP